MDPTLDLLRTLLLLCENRVGGKKDRQTDQKERHLLVSPLPVVGGCPRSPLVTMYTAAKQTYTDFLLECQEASKIRGTEISCN